MDRNSCMTLARALIRMRWYKRQKYQIEPLITAERRLFCRVLKRLEREYWREMGHEDGKGPEIN